MKTNRFVLTASEMHKQAQKFNPGSAPGFDGWSPAELRKLPLQAWKDREHVERRIYAEGRLPNVYLQVPISMLRKGDGLTPLQHRGISVFPGNYRLMAGVWWTRVLPSLVQWVHPDACGAVPGRECLEAAFDAQLDFELSIINGEEQTQIGTDYDKFFDTFDPNFMHSLHIAVGLPTALADVILYMYSNIQRRLKINKHLGKPLVCNRGAGQGDTYAVLGAHFLTTIQFRHVSHECPTVKKSAVVDDRSFRGK